MNKKTQTVVSLVRPTKLCLSDVLVLLHWPWAVLHTSVVLWSELTVGSLYWCTPTPHPSQSPLGIPGAHLHYSGRGGLSRGSLVLEPETAKVFHGISSYRISSCWRRTPSSHPGCEESPGAPGSASVVHPLVFPLSSGNLDNKAHYSSWTTFWSGASWCISSDQRPCFLELRVKFPLMILQLELSPPQTPHRSSCLSEAICPSQPTCCIETITLVKRQRSPTKPKNNLQRGQTWALDKTEHDIALVLHTRKEKELVIY